MGAYLSQPITEKEVFLGKARGVRYAGCSMQGWRRNMEDAHLAAVGLRRTEPGLAAFGVFDGHGGAEVARFCQRHFVKQLVGTDTFPSDLEASLIEAFHAIDDCLRDTMYHGELVGLRNGPIPSCGRKVEPIPEDKDVVSCARAAVETLWAHLKWLSRFLSRPSSWRKRVNDAKGDTKRKVNGRANGRAYAHPQPRAKKPHKVVLHTEKFSATAGACCPDCPGPVQAGCTAVVAVKRGRELIVANAGDSRGVLCRGGKAVAMSRDHKPHLSSERTRIVSAGGFVTEIGGMNRVNGNLNVSRSIGDLKFKRNKNLSRSEQIVTAEPEIRKFSLTREDKFFVLACDGIWDVLDNQQVVDYVSAGLVAGVKLEQICAKLLDVCLASDPTLTRGLGCDNMTILIVELP